MRSELTLGEQEKIANGGTVLRFDMDVPQHIGVNRVYGYLERGPCAGQIVSIPSLYFWDNYKKDLGFVWVSRRTTVPIGRAG